MINLEKSFIYIKDNDRIGRKDLWRTNINSILTTRNKKYFLTKETRAQFVGEHPFSHPHNYEFFKIIEGDNTHIFRKYSVGKNIEKVRTIGSKEFYSTKKEITDTDIKYLNFHEAHGLILSNSPKNIFCEINYSYENVEFNLITKCEHVIFNTSKDGTKFLQPSFGYVPFISKNKIDFGYAVLNVKENTSGHLEFLLNQTSKIFVINKDEKFFKSIIKKILNVILFFYFKNDFTKLISIKDSKISFYQYI